MPLPASRVLFRVPSGAGNLALLLPLALVSGCASPPQVETLCELDERPGNPAVTPDGRLLLSMHPIDEPVFKVVEIMERGEVRPFPNVSWSREGLAAVIGIEATRDGRVWMLDMGSDLVQPKLVVWDTRRARLDRSLPIPRDVLREGSFLQDLAIDEARGVAILADMDRGSENAPARPAFIALDTATGAARRLLEGHASLLPTAPGMQLDGREITTEERGASVPLRLGLNPISIDPGGDWIYYGALTGTLLWRVPAAALSDAELAPADLAALVEERGPKAVSDGIRAADGGRVFVTDLENDGIGVSDGATYELLVQDHDLLSWPDGLAFGPDGVLIATVNQLHRHPSFNGGLEASSRPFRVVRVRELRRQVNRSRFAKTAREAWSGPRVRGAGGGRSRGTGSPFGSSAARR